jgi:hypothetical protein
MFIPVGSDASDRVCHVWGSRFARYRVQGIVLLNKALVPESVDYLKDGFNFGNYSLRLFVLGFDNCDIAVARWW